MTRHPHSKAFSIRSRVANVSPIPNILYLDANAILDAVLSRRYGQDVDAYLQHVVNNDGMITWSYMTVNEIRNIIHVDQYINFADTHGIQPDDNRPAWKIAENSVSVVEGRIISESVLDRTGQIFKDLEMNYGLQLEAGNPVAENQLAVSLYGKYGGGYNDALHVAIANAAGVNNVLTQDARFLMYPYLNVFGASKKVHDQRSSDNSLVPHMDYFSLDEGEVGE